MGDYPFRCPKAKLAYAASAVPNEARRCELCAISLEMT